MVLNERSGKGRAKHNVGSRCRTTTGRKGKARGTEEQDERERDCRSSEVSEGGSGESKGERAYDFFKRFILLVQAIGSSGDAICYSLSILVRS